ncbi:MAG: Lrp/AsnC family transcriptional regulator [Dehalococcoidia bacterium]|nr:Lrp/AsnC family transcriptional regulator [Dehalococcoidia bacterium]
MNLEILKILEKDARVEPAQIAIMTGLPVEQVKEEIAQAERERIILRYKTFINWEKTGTEQVWALIEVRVVPQRGKGFDAIAERIYRFPEARSVYLVSGTYDLAVQVVGRTMMDIASFVSGKLASLDGVQGTTTHFLMKKYKEDGEIMEAIVEGSRLAVSP